MVQEVCQSQFLQTFSARLYLACKKGDNKKVRSLLNLCERQHLDCVDTKNKLLNMANDNGETALHAAAAEGHTDIVFTLLSNGARPQTKTQYGKSPLVLAAIGGHLNAVARLLKWNPDKDSVTAALLYATAAGNYKLIQLLVEHDAELNPDIDHISEFGQVFSDDSLDVSPLALTARFITEDSSGDTEGMKAIHSLIEHGASIISTSDVKSFKVSQLLEEHGASNAIHTRVVDEINRSTIEICNFELSLD